MSLASELKKLSGIEISNLIKQKKISPTELVKSTWEEMQLVNKDLNAICESMYEEALEIANHATIKLTRTSAQDLPLYFGVPFTIKEMLAVKGKKRTAGNYHYRNEVMDFNSTVVERVLKSGAIPMATTNVPELGFWFETDNVVYGRTNNPYDLSRTCGGSTGGEAALVGAGVSPFGLGSDIGGSIRMPAAFCGVYGHKPTWKSVPLTGSFPSTQESIQEDSGPAYALTTLGYLCRRAEDLFPLMSLLIGPDGFDPETRTDYVLGEPLKSMKGLKVFIMPDPKIFLCRGTDEEMQDEVRNFAEKLSQDGAEIEELDPSLFKKSILVWAKALGENRSQSFQEKLTRGSGINWAKDVFDFVKGKGKYTFPSFIISLLEGKASDSNGVQEAKEELHRIDQVLKEKLGSTGVLLLPTHPRVAPKHRQPYRSPFDFLMTGIFNALGYPATSAPTQLNSKGLPLSVQVVALPFQDHLCLSVAAKSQDYFKGWTPPPGPH